MIPVLAAFAGGLTAQTIEQNARRVLDANCNACHGATAMSGLDLRTREAALKGGSRGPAVVPGNPSASLIYQAVLRQGDLKMPPGKQALSAADAATLKSWIEGGAAFTAPAAAAEPTWWSFKKPRRPAIPGSASANPIDALLKTAAPAADRRTLIRRATFDLHGLPPTPAETAAFVNDPDPKAYEKLVARLLGSPRYGERWGRLWLDVVRYADTGGYETDVLFPNAWRYRDYVIRSFNQDKPYDVFVQEQIAADEIWPDNLELDGSYDLPESKKKNLERRIGTSLYTLAAMPVEYSFFGDQLRAEWQAESVETTAAAFLGLTFNCARCHDHKFDPISQKDFYRLSAFFAGSEEREVPIVSQMRIFEYTRFQTKQVHVDDLRARYNGLKPGDKDGRETLLRQIGEAYVKTPRMYDKATLLVHTAPVPDTHVLQRGDWKNRGEKVLPGTPAALGPSPEIVEPPGNLFITQRRRALAQWLTSREHPLTARVMVNRIWQSHFGRGLAGTPNDFGRQGEAPTNPELLDWLAVEFMDRGWSMKEMHRQILMSSAYQARRRPQRIDAESIRDAVLAVSGTLNPDMYGPPVVTPLSEDEEDGMRDMSMWPITPDETQHDRRSIYMFVKRSFRLPMLDTFDAPDTSQSCARRDTSTVAPQALALMNSEWMSRQSARFAASLAKASDPVGEAWRRALARDPSGDERARAQSFLKESSLQRLCLMLFNMSEFIYVD